MVHAHRLLALLGGFAAAVLAVIFGMAVGHADVTTDPDGGGPRETCDGAVCLVMNDPNLKDWDYSGIRPFFTDWQNAAQTYTVQVTGADGSTVDAGTYNVKVEDYWSPVISVSQYHYGDFVPVAGVDPDFGESWMNDLSGASVYKSEMLGGLITQTTINNVGPHDASYIVFSAGGITTTTVYDQTASAAYIQVGDQAPTFLWNSLFHPDLAEATVPGYVIPADPFAGLDFDPNDFLAGGVAAI